MSKLSTWRDGLYQKILSRMDGDPIESKRLLDSLIETECKLLNSNAKPNLLSESEFTPSDNNAKPKRGGLKGASATIQDLVELEKIKAEMYEFDGGLVSCMKEPRKTSAKAKLRQIAEGAIGAKKMQKHHTAVAQWIKTIENILSKHNTSFDLDNLS